MSVGLTLAGSPCTSHTSCSLVVWKSATIDTKDVALFTEDIFYTALFSEVFRAISGVRFNVFVRKSSMLFVPLSFLLSIVGSFVLDFVADSKLTFKVLILVCVTVITSLYVCFVSLFSRGCLIFCSVANYRSLAVSDVVRRIICNNYYDLHLCTLYHLQLLYAYTLNKTRFHDFSWLKIDINYVRSQPLTQNVNSVVRIIVYHGQCIKLNVKFVANV